MPSDQLEQFEIEIVGPKPEDVEFGDLAEFVNSLQEAVAGTLGTVEKATASLRLVAVSEGSDRLTLAVPRDAVSSVVQISSRVTDGNYSALPRRAHAALSEMSRIVRKRRWGFRFVRNVRLNIQDTLVPADREIPPPAVEAIKGATMLLARCMRVGGVKPRAELRLPNRETLLHVDITEAIAKQLRVYDDVVLAGEATWDAGTWEIVDFAVTSVSSYQSAPPDVSFRELARSAGGAWDHVDAEEFVSAQRTEPSA